MMTPSTEESIEEVATEHFWRFYVRTIFGIVPSDDEKNE